MGSLETNYLKMNGIFAIVSIVDKVNISTHENIKHAKKCISVTKIPEDTVIIDRKSSISPPDHCGCNFGLPD